MKGDSLIAPRDPDVTNPSEDGKVVEALQRWIHKVLPGLQDNPNHTEPCMYTVSFH